MTGARQWAARRGPLSALPLALALVALLAGCAGAPGIGLEDDRKRADVSKPPWHSLGVVRTDIGASCTGTLVGPRTVLTAAHCLYGPRTLKPLPPNMVHFVLPAAARPLALEGNGVAYITGKGFSPADGMRPSTDSNADADWALLQLDRDMGARDQILPLAPAYARPGMRLGYGGYQADQPRVLLADFDCKVLAYDRISAGGVMLRHSCTGTQGASGGPLIGQTSDGVWVVVGIGSLAASGRSGGWAVPTMAIALAFAGTAQRAP